MKKILAFGASSSSKSINKRFAEFTANSVENAQVNLIDLNDFEMPIYSMDREQENGIPQLAKDFKELIKEADGIIISFAEHNSSFSAAYKNVFDWASRVEKDMWHEKPMLLLATSPGGRGGQGVLAHAVANYSHRNKNIVSFSLPSFGQNFDNGIKDEELRLTFEDKLNDFSSML